MGNCLVLQENIVRVVKADGKVLEYKEPIKVHQVLTQFFGHAISESLPVVRHLHPDTKLLRGQLYYLVPPASSPSPKASKKKVRFANPEVESEEESSVVRIKLVISKKELQNMLCKGGISINNILPLVHGEKGQEDGEDNKTDDYGCQGWKPALESIPEVN
ncbi:uncharacterized protein LOC114740763 [Neltuma alba]|uniref:uncharacterized protein LOC114728562 n=1 Tax=Neltuma alba TaxID=207710 RepID=UPI0010A46502|nr:uncharacterized protein LOC114728562 [Prosopis alba]XP_028784809.1 uncharacterized protein LOC114740763 [Prosopis alba]